MSEDPTTEDSRVDLHTTFGTAVDRVGRAVVVRAVGEVDMLTAPRLEEAVLAACADDPPMLVIDLSKVDFMGSAGLAVLSLARRRCEPGIDLRVVADGPAARAIELTGLAEELHVYPDPAGALADQSP